MHHFRTTKKNYNAHNKLDIKKKVACSLCAAVAGESPIEETDSMVILPNRVAYDIFEGRRTTGEHYMILPKKHRESLAEFTEEEMKEMVTLAGKYEKEGFNIYARGWGSVSRSQKHQHTHLIRLSNKPARLMVYLSRPYILFHR